MGNRVIEVIGGGTVFHVRNHLALTAPAYGSTARAIYRILDSMSEFDGSAQAREYGGWPEGMPYARLNLTKMANKGEGDLETNQDVERLVDKMIANPDTWMIFFNPALVDYEAAVAASGEVGYEWSDDIKTRSGKY